MMGHGWWKSDVRSCGMGPRLPCKDFSNIPALLSGGRSFCNRPLRPRPPAIRMQLEPARASHQTLFSSGPRHPGPSIHTPATPAYSRSRIWRAFPRLYVLWMPIGAVRTSVVPKNGLLLFFGCWELLLCRGAGSRIFLCGFFGTLCGSAYLCLDGKALYGCSIESIRMERGHAASQSNGH